MLDALRLDNGITMHNMAIRCMSYFGPMAYETEEYHAAYSELIADNDVIPLEYTDPSSSGRSKTLLFIRGTMFLNLAGVEFSIVTKKPSSKTDMA